MASPLEAQDIPITVLTQQGILYFDRNTTELSPLGREKLGNLIREWGKGGVWVIGIPRNSGASDAVNQGRVRTLVSLLMEQGIIGVRTQPVPPVAHDAYDPLVIGKISQASTEVEAAKGDIDPNEDDPTPRPMPPQTVQKVPPDPPTVEAVPPAPSLMAATAPSWVALSAQVAYQSASVATPPTVRMEASPYPVVGVGVVAVPGALRLEAGYAKSARNAFGVKEQGEPDRKLDVSDASTTFSEQVSFSLGLTQGFLPLQFSYVDEKQSLTAVLPKGALILDRAGEGWVSLVDDVRFAYRTRVKSSGLDWRFGDSERDARTYWLGFYSDKTEKPFSLYESGAFENHVLYTATYTVTGLRVRIQGDPFREGLAFDDVELKAGRAKNLELLDKYHLLLAEVTKQGFNEASLRVSPRYLTSFGKRGFVRFSLPLTYTLNTAKSQTTEGAGYTQLTGLYGNRFTAGVRLEVGFRK
ncbi:hypothetical protein [Geothrix sp. PMB-07]|uniref:hypothetical protein n=1 Tax=Geothrix sp. PMB-07 TaxID=3068640 RepID=UPI002740F704|nr:hypothetical protein [Geothrix sp. PMB-07]WLT32487.1 hypothetical protein Q9293_03960 [Geothrix sp. PMB-07]